METKEKERELITYIHDGEWSGSTLHERADGLWVRESWSAVQNWCSGRRVVLRPPEGWTVKDEADMDTRLGDMTKAEVLIVHGTEVRCLRRGHIMQ